MNMGEDKIEQNRGLEFLVLLVGEEANKIEIATRSSVRKGNTLNQKIFN